MALLRHTKEYKNADHLRPLVAWPKLGYVQRNGEEYPQPQGARHLAKYVNRAFAAGIIIGAGIGAAVMALVLH